MPKKSSNHIDTALAKLTRLGVFQVSDAEIVGVTRLTITRLCSAGKLRRLAPGLYADAGAKLDPETLDFRIACIRCGPESFIGGLTALFYYGITEEVPDRTWVIAPREIRSPSKMIRLIRSSKSTTVGVIAEKDFRIASPERAILEGLWYRTKIGEGVAIAAARKALLTRKVERKKLYEVAKMLELSKVLERYWEAISSK